MQRTRHQLEHQTRRRRHVVRRHELTRNRRIGGNNDGLVLSEGPIQAELLGADQRDQPAGGKGRVGLVRDDLVDRLLVPEIAAIVEGNLQLPVEQLEGGALGSLQNRDDEGVAAGRLKRLQRLDDRDLDEALGIVDRPVGRILVVFAQPVSRDLQVQGLEICGEDAVGVRDAQRIEPIALRLLDLGEELGQRRGLRVGERGIDERVPARQRQVLQGLDHRQLDEPQGLVGNEIAAEIEILGEAAGNFEAERLEILQEDRLGRVAGHLELRVLHILSKLRDACGVGLPQCVDDALLAADDVELARGPDHGLLNRRLRAHILVLAVPEADEGPALAMPERNVHVARAPVLAAGQLDEEVDGLRHRVGEIHGEVAVAAVLNRDVPDMVIAVLVRRDDGPGPRLGPEHFPEPVAQERPDERADEGADSGQQDRRQRSGRSREQSAHPDRVQNRRPDAADAAADAREPRADRGPQAAGDGAADGAGRGLRRQDLTRQIPTDEAADPDGQIPEQQRVALPHEESAAERVENGFLVGNILQSRGDDGVRRHLEQLPAEAIADADDFRQLRTQKRADGAHGLSLQCVDKV